MPSPDARDMAQMLEGWEINSITTIGKPAVLGSDRSWQRCRGYGSSAGEPAGDAPIRWSFLRQSPPDFKSGPTPIPFFGPGDPNSACAAQALVSGRGRGRPSHRCLESVRLLCEGQFGHDSRRRFGHFGNMGRNMFPRLRLPEFRFLDRQELAFRRTSSAQFRAEFFNIFNHPNFANPYGGQNGFGLNDPSVQPFGCGCATPDVAAANPAVGSGGSRAVQLGVKVMF